MRGPLACRRSRISRRCTLRPGSRARRPPSVNIVLIDTLLKDLRRRFEGKDEARRDWTLDPECYTLAQVANLLRTFLSKEKAAAYAGEVRTRVRLCGYSAGRPLAEVWEILLLGSDSPTPTQVQGEQDFGIRWDGEYEALSRLIFELGNGFEGAAVCSGLTRDAARELHAKLSPLLFELLFVEAMPIPRCGRSGAFPRGNDDWLREVFRREAQDGRRLDRDRRYHQA
jgi:hypothetical protein